MATGTALAQTAPEPQGDDRRQVSDVITVTAQKREENIQDVPIAVSAFSTDDLNMRGIEGGSELLRAIPNVAFSKNNFSMYNFSIRGIGTQAISASSDPAVAISFNNSPLIRNRLFEQEYFDIQRVEVLRGPQGTLYGRNATGGVVNMIPNLPEPGLFEGSIEGEIGGYDSRRLRGFINLPLGDTFAVRLAGAATRRDGFDYNLYSDRHVNDRDLWSTRVSALWRPNDRFSANLIWEHFEEDDSRSRTGKQLCTTDPGSTQIGGTPVPAGTVAGLEIGTVLQDQFSQGCLPGSLYADAAYNAPNGGSLTIVRAASLFMTHGFDANGDLMRAPALGQDPFAGAVVSRDMREINAAIDPRFRAENDVFQLNLALELTDNLTLYSQTAYTTDSYWSTQDYGRFLSDPIFPDTSQSLDAGGNPAPSPFAPGGIYTDPQLGPSSRMLSADLSRSDNSQWYQELRLQSSFDHGFNFSLGANYLRFESQDDYFVFSNLFTAMAEYNYNDQVYPVTTPTALCDENYYGGIAAPSPVFTECVYVDPTSIDNLAGDGHNYFRSLNVVETRSWAAFGEGYWEISPELRLTLGLRYTDDRKTSTPYPSQLLLGAQIDGGPGSCRAGIPAGATRPIPMSNWAGGP
ncbi:MAG: TonB-dependent receptor [Oceanicaulis sp.]|nr:TonB-dependent receptor [Oceanicaulis sp.]